MNSDKFNYFLVDRDSFVHSALDAAEQSADQAIAMVTEFGTLAKKSRAVLAICPSVRMDLPSYFKQTEPKTFVTCFFSDKALDQENWVSFDQLHKQQALIDVPHTDLLKKLYVPKCDDCGMTDHEFTAQSIDLCAALNFSAIEIIGTPARYQDEQAAKQAKIFGNAATKGVIAVQPFKVFTDWIYRIPASSAIDPPQSRQVYPLELKQLTCDEPVEVFKSEQSRLPGYMASQFKPFYLGI